MRRILLVSALLGAMLWPATSAAAPDAASGRWMMMIVTAGRHGATDVKWRFELRGHLGPGTQMFGVAEANYRPRANTPNVSCALVLGGPDGDPSTKFAWHNSGPIDRLEPGQRLAEVAFYVGSTVMSHRLDAVARTGSVKVQRVYGSGVRGIFLAPGPLASTRDVGVVAAHGLVGGFATSRISPTTVGAASWTASDGTSESFVNDGLKTRGCSGAWNPAFAGAAGNWQFSWKGVGPGGGPVAAWASLGRYWPLFRGSEGGVVPVDIPTGGLTFG
jgi:hypothetical protein